MARGASKSSGNSRIRFVMLEAEVEDGDFSQITQAIQNALGPRKIIQTQVLRPDEVSAELLEQANSAAQQTDSAAQLNGCESDNRDSAPVTKGKSSAKRSFPTPEVVDVNWIVTPSIEEFVGDHPPKSMTDRFLVVMAWFKEAAGEGSVTTNQVYTVFRKLKWPTAIKDFSQPLRDLKSQQLVTGGSKQGFSINHLGSARVEEMKP